MKSLSINSVKDEKNPQSKQIVLICAIFIDVSYGLLQKLTEIVIVKLSVTKTDLWHPDGWLSHHILQFSNTLPSEFLPLCSCCSWLGIVVCKSSSPCDCESEWSVSDEHNNWFNLSCFINLVWYAPDLFRVFLRFQLHLLMPGSWKSFFLHISYSKQNFYVTSFGKL